MDDSTVEVSFIEYEKEYINATEKDNYNETDKNSRRTKMPSDDKPPRNQTYKDMGKMNNTCNVTWNVPLDFNVTELALSYGKSAAIKIQEETNGTLTLKICKRKQYKPRTRNNTDGSVKDEEDMSDAKRERYEKVHTDKVMDDADLDYMDTEGMDGWNEEADGKEYYKDENGKNTTWGKRWKRRNNKTEETDPEEGYGKPSKGDYSIDLGGYKTFGTDGQGNSTVGVKDDNSTTCSDRIILLTITALEDTTTTPVVTSSQLRVLSTSGSSM